MVPNEVRHTSLANGMTVVVETMPSVQSTAFSMLIPAGSAFDPPNQNGTATALADWISRGAGNRTSRDILADLDRLGVQSRETASIQHLAISGSCLADNLIPALQLYSDVVRHPLLDDDEFDAVLSGVEQSLLAIEDDPQKKVMIELARRCFPSPWNHPSDGTLEDLENITPESTREFFKRNVHPSGAILGIAGNVRMDDILPALENAFGEWSGSHGAVIQNGERGPLREHISHESTQTHIGLAYPAISYGDPDYYSAWAAVNVLSGGMSSRLFTEVREKRGLCYSVYATLSTLKDQGQVLCYAGTTSERAQETLDVLRNELIRLGDGISEDELDRCKARAKSSLIMAQESTASRASSLSRNWYYLGRTLTLNEVRSRIEALTVSAVLDYVHAHPAKDFTTLTIGPTELK